MKRNLCADGLILAGDAAGFVDPLSGEGLAYAIQSGQLAAKAVLSAAQNKGFLYPNLKIYRDSTCQAFGRELRYSFFLTKLLYRFPSLFLLMLCSDK